MSNDPNTKKVTVHGFFNELYLASYGLSRYNSDQVISSAEQLEKLEQKVCNLANKLQAVIIEERLQSSLDSKGSIISTSYIS